MPIQPVSNSPNEAYIKNNGSQLQTSGIQRDDEKFNLQDVLSMTAMGGLGILPIALCIPFLAEFNLKYLNPIEAFKGLSQKLFQGNHIKMLWLPVIGAALGLCYGLYQYAADNFFNSKRQVLPTT